MIVGFFGKGGSGKTTVSTLFSRFLATEGNRVLAIDADHNMDFSYNISATLPENFLGQSLHDLLTFQSITQATSYRQVLQSENALHFSFSPPDSFTAKYSVEISPRLRLMTAGPHTNEILHDVSCSHSLSTPLKVYLPLLKLHANDYVVVDEKAGADGVGTGIVTGLSFAFVLAEDTVYGIKAARQIADILEFYDVPYAFVLTKVRNDTPGHDTSDTLHQVPCLSIPFSDEISQLQDESFMKFGAFLKKYAIDHAGADVRMSRTLSKLQKNKVFLTNAT